MNSLPLPDTVKIRCFYLCRLLSCLSLSLALAARLRAEGAGSAPTAPNSTRDASTSDEDTVKLPEFNVTGTPVNPYNAEEASTAARTATKLLDTPMTAYIVTPALLQDIAPLRMFDATAYFPGVSGGRGADENDRQDFRGFENFTKTIDSFPEVMMPYMYGNFGLLPTLFDEHLELILGPDSILNPTGSPGGTLAVVTKSPQFKPSTDISATVGNYEGNKLTLDTTGPLGDGKHMAYRVMGEYQDAKYFDQGTIRIFAVGAEFTYKFTDTAKLTVKYFADDVREGGTMACETNTGEMAMDPSTVGGATLPTAAEPGFSYDGWNGDGTDSLFENRENILEAELTAALSKHINMRLGAQIDYSHLNVQKYIPGPPLTETWNQTTGVETAVASFPLTACPMVAFYHPIEDRQIQFQNDFAGSFSTGGVSLQPQVGWAYDNGEMPLFYTAQDKNVPTVNLLQNNGAYTLPPPPNSAYTTVSQNTPGNATTMQVYTYLRAGFFNDRLFATVGASRTWAQMNTYSIPYLEENGFSVGNPSAPVTLSTFSHTNNPLAPSVQPWHDAYVSGLLAKVLPNVSVYGTFSTNAALASNTPLWMYGKQYEFGAKASFFNNRIRISADHFQIRQFNYSFNNPLVNIGLSTVQNIFQTLSSRGEEVSVQGGVTQDLSIIASYTNQQLRDPWGRRQRNTPDNMANMLLNYHFTAGLLKNLEVFAGVQHIGSVAGETVTGFTSLGVPEQPGFYLQSFNLVNAGAGYQWGRYRYNLNVDNVLDQHAWWEAQNRGSLVPVPLATVTLTMTVHI